MLLKMETGTALLNNYVLLYMILFENMQATVLYI